MRNFIQRVRQRPEAVSGDAINATFIWSECYTLERTRNDTTFVCDSYYTVDWFTRDK